MFRLKCTCGRGAFPHPNCLLCTHLLWSLCKSNGQSLGIRKPFGQQASQKARRGLPILSSMCHFWGRMTVCPFRSVKFHFSQGATHGEWAEVCFNFRAPLSMLKSSQKLPLINNSPDWLSDNPSCPTNVNASTLVVWKKCFQQTNFQHQKATTNENDLLLLLMSQTKINPTSETWNAWNELERVELLVAALLLTAARSSLYRFLCYVHLASTHPNLMMVESVSRKPKSLPFHFCSAEPLSTQRHFQPNSLPWQNIGLH